jgi:hypothetical protein
MPGARDRESKNPSGLLLPMSEEEMVRAFVVAILYQLDQEAEEVLIELDRLLGVLADQGEVMDP